MNQTNTLKALTARRSQNRKKAVSPLLNGDDLVETKGKAERPTDNKSDSPDGNKIHSPTTTLLYSDDSGTHENIKSLENSNSILSTNSPPSHVRSPPLIGNSTEQISLLETKKKKPIFFSSTITRKSRFDNKSRIESLHNFDINESYGEESPLQNLNQSSENLKDDDIDVDITTRLATLPIILQNRIGYKLPIEELNSSVVHTQFTYSMVEDKVNQLEQNVDETEARISKMHKQIQKINGYAYALNQTATVVEAKLDNLNEWFDKIDVTTQFHYEMMEIFVSFFSILASLFVLIWRSLKTEFYYRKKSKNQVDTKDENSAPTVNLTQVPKNQGDKKIRRRSQSMLYH